LRQAIETDKVSCYRNRGPQVITMNKTAAFNRSLYNEKVEARYQVRRWEHDTRYIQGLRKHLDASIGSQQRNSLRWKEPHLTPKMPNLARRKTLTPPRAVEYLQTAMIGAGGLSTTLIISQKAQFEANRSKPLHLLKG
jgi:hypothetical protein